MNVEGVTFIGIAERVGVDGKGEPISHVRPLFMSGDMAVWRVVKPSVAKDEFPNAGLVTCYGVRMVAGSCWSFQVVEHKTFLANNPHHDRFKVAGAAEPLSEVIDLSYVEVDDARILLTREGIEIGAHIPQPCRALLRDELVYGPLQLEKAGRKWLLEQKQRDHDLITVSKVLPEDSLLRFGDSQPRVVLAPGKKSATARVGQADWSDDPILMKRVLRDVRRRDKEFAAKAQLTDAAVDRLVRSMEEAGQLAPGALSLEAQRLRRAKLIIPNLARNASLTEEVVGHLLKLPEANAQIESAAERAKLNAVEQIRKEHADLLEEVASLQSQLAELREAIATTRADAEGQAEAIRLDREKLLAESEARIRDLLSRPSEVIAEAAVLRPLIHAVTMPDSGYRSATVANKSAGAQASWPVSEASEIAIGKIAAVLRRAAKERAISPGPLMLLHASFLAGAIPVLGGPNARECIEAYANSMIGGRTITLPVSSAVVDLDSILGTREASLLLWEALEAARSIAALHLVILEGINRSPVDAYLSGLAPAYQDSITGRGFRSVPGRSGSGHPAWVQWPSNVLMVGTAAPASIGVRPSAMFWQYSSFIMARATDATRAETGDSGQSTERTFTELPLEKWRALMDGPGGGEAALDGLFHEAIDGALMGEAGRRTWRRMATVLADLVPDSPNRYLQLLAGTLGVSADDEQLAQLAPQVAEAGPGSDDFLTLARQAREVLGEE